MFMFILQPFSPYCIEGEGGNCVPVLIYSNKYLLIFKNLKGWQIIFPTATNKFSHVMILTSVSDPDPHGSALRWPPWIWFRIRIRDADSGSGSRSFKITEK